jgi:hypothetical protein
MDWESEPRLPRPQAGHLGSSGWRGRKAIWPRRKKRAALPGSPLYPLTMERALRGHRKSRRRAEIV